MSSFNSTAKETDIYGDLLNKISFCVVFSVHFNQNVFSFLRLQIKTWNLKWTLQEALYRKPKFVNKPQWELCHFFVIDAIERMQVNHFYWKKMNLSTKLSLLFEVSNKWQL